MSSAPIRRRAQVSARGTGSATTRCCLRVPARSRKGQDQLIRSLPAIARAVPGVRLLIVGDGPQGPALCRLAARTGVTERVVFAGSVAWSDLPEYYAAGDVFAMPCRTRRAGLDVEGLGIVFLEAAAAGLPVIAGASGGAPETVEHGRTGVVVDGRDTGQVAVAATELLADPDRARSWGLAGRQLVQHRWNWNTSAARLVHFLTGRGDRSGEVDHSA